MAEEKKKQIHANLAFANLWMPSNPSVCHANRHPGTEKATMRIVERELQNEIVSDWKSWEKNIQT